MAHLARLVLDGDEVDDVGGENGHDEIDEEDGDADREVLRPDEEKEADEEEEKADDLGEEADDERVAQVVHVADLHEFVDESDEADRADVQDETGHYEPLRGVHLVEARLVCRADGHLAEALNGARHRHVLNCDRPVGIGDIFGDGAWRHETGVPQAKEVVVGPVANPVVGENRRDRERDAHHAHENDDEELREVLVEAGDVLGPHVA